VEGVQFIFDVLDVGEFLRDVLDSLLPLALGHTVGGAGLRFVVGDEAMAK
jgi:hypothetical protein